MSEKEKGFTSEDYETAMVDIGIGRTWDECRIENKNTAKKKKWDSLVKEIKEAKIKGGLWTSHVIRLIALNVYIF